MNLVNLSFRMLRMDFIQGDSSILVRTQGRRKQVCVGEQKFPGALFWKKGHSLIN